MAELVALFTNRYRIRKPLQIQYTDLLRTQPWVDVVHIGKAVDSEGWQKLAVFADKTWSLVDCVSFVLMDQRRIDEALTTDHHFEQAGFVRLLK